MSEVERQGREARVRRIVERRAEQHGVLARCRPARRRSDLAMVFLRGPRLAVLGLPLVLFDDLDGYDIEIIRSGDDEKRYLLVLAVTDALSAQEPRIPERRAKLRRRLEREGREPEGGADGRRGRESRRRDE